MAKYVKVSALAAGLYSPAPKISPEGLVEETICYWQEQLEVALAQRPDLIVLPECCDWPFGFAKEKTLAYYRARQGRIRDYFSQVARTHNCYLTYPTEWEDSGIWRNSVFVLDRQGAVAGIYHKNYPTIGAMEGGCKAGRGPAVIPCDFGTVAPVVCFDLNFTDLAQSYREEKPDLVIFSSLYHGGLMQRWWAYHVGAHFIGVPAGQPASIIAPGGQVLAQGMGAITRTINLDCVLVKYEEEKIRALQLQYGSWVTISKTGVFQQTLLTSKLPERTAKELFLEFGLEPWRGNAEECGR
jgi:hypothetical protein